MIVNRIYEWARVQPAKTAIICNDAIVSYGFLARAIDSQRRFFSPWNLLPGKTAIVIVPNMAFTWTVVLALRSLGLVTIATDSLERAKSLGVRDVECVVTHHTSRDFAAAKSAISRSTKFIELPDTIRDDALSGTTPSTYDTRIPFGDHIIYTSGTTGRYKKIRKLGKHVIAHADYLVREHQLDGASVNHVLDYPMWTLLGYGYPLASWLSGGRVIFKQSKDRLENLFDYGVTQLTVTPLMLRQLSAMAEKSGRRHDEMHLNVGGGFAPYADVKQVVATLTKNILIGYGASELGSGVMAAQFSSREDLDTFKPIAGRTIEIVDENGVERPLGEEGEMRVRLDEFDSTGYMDDAETTAKFFRDGYFYPGDLAMKLADGRIRLVGRVADVMNIQGFKVAVAPIERAMQSTLNLDEVCVFSNFNDEGSEEVVIVIQTDALPPNSELDSAARHLPPGATYRFVNVKRFPRTETGMSKVNRAALKQMIVKGADRA